MRKTYILFTFIVPNMDAKSAVFTLVSIRPFQGIDIARRLPFAKHTVYKAIKDLETEGLIVKIKRNSKYFVTVADGFRPQKLKEIYIHSLSYGIDSEMLLRESTIMVWSQLKNYSTLKDLVNHTNLSERWIREILTFLDKESLIVFKKRKPIIVIRNNSHPMNSLLEALLISVDDDSVIYQSGSTPFDEMVKTPSQIEKILYEQIDGSLTVKGTGFQVRKPGDRLKILESVDEDFTREDFFLMKILTTEGVEDICVRLVASGKLNYQLLLEKASLDNLVNIVGCYLDILNSIRQFVPPQIISMFEKKKIRRKRFFLKEESDYGKDGWEDFYEKKWNLNIFLDLGAIRHGVRAI